MTFEVEDLYMPNIHLSNVDDVADFKDFQSNNGNFLTSTLLDELEVFQNINMQEDDVDTILSKISTIKTVVSSFARNMQKDLHELKEMVKTKINIEHLTSQYGNDSNDER